MITRRPLTIRTAAVFLGALMLVYLFLAVIFRSRASWYPNASDALLLTTNSLATVALIYAAVQSRRRGHPAFPAWAVMAAAQGMYVLGDAIFIYINTVMGQAPFPSIADVFYLAYYPVFGAGLLLLPVGRLSRSERQKIGLDIAIIMFSAGLLVWNFLVAPIASDTESSVWQIIFSTAYPLFDLVLFFMLNQVVFRNLRQATPALLLIQAGVFVGIAADVGFTLESFAGTYAAGSLVDLAYAFSYSLVALAGIVQAVKVTLPDELPLTRPSSLTAVDRRLGWVIYMPYVWGLLAYLVLAFHEQVALLPSSILAAAVGVIFVLILLRQIISLSENTALYTNELHRRHLAEALSGAAREMTTTLDPHLAPALILDQLSLVVPYERCSIMLEENKRLFIAARRGFPEEDERTDGIIIAIRDKDPFLKIQETHEPFVLADVTQAPGWTILPWLPLNKSWMGVPLIVRDQVIGMISLTRREAGAFSMDDQILAVAFAGQAAVALDNAHLYGQLNQAYHTLEIINRTKSNFIEIVAHELRTPLTVIKGYSQTLAMQSSIQEEKQNIPLLDGILRGVQRMQELVNNMLDMIKIDNQVLKLSKEAVELSTLLQETIAQYSKALQERNMAASIENLNDLPAIQADPDLLHKVFSQLVMNAIKYTPDGGKITIQGSFDKNERMVEIVVVDTGIGLDPSQREVIFEKFYQTGQVSLHSSGQTKFKGGGPGLGLPIARGIVAAHGGKIWVESAGHDEKLCPGSQFHVRLPV